MAFTATMLGWGLVDFAEGQETAGQMDYGRATVKWATDYFLKAHTAHFEFYGQVGKGTLDHDYWGRPEDMTMERPAWDIDSKAPGSDLAAETAAALAAAAIVFQEVDPQYSSEMLGVAQELYEFADEKREMYSNSITDAAQYYKSWSGYGDELCWGALWLYRATRNDTYLMKAHEAWDEFDLGAGAEEFSWDDKKAGVYALFTLLEPDDEKYPAALKEFLRHIREDMPYTPGGLVFINKWGANRHAANVAFLSLWAAKQGMNVKTNRDFATSQINYILGDVGHSFVIGYGVDPPQKPHHRSSSCPWPPESCLGYQQNPGPNPHTLYGALVGGPDQDGNWVDDRLDYVHNEVACDYNAAFTGALAGMIETN
ncbi:Endoglucanase 1-like [Homarus americanus]|uniref:Endoglucanase n=3 Tax=Homarus americanus TaxID=6706 RepID=A0A8J5THP1_HOMAM|nr:Endoglucanase 1-like [Homarus americanus]